jgi:hypothetical protein
MPLAFAVMKLRGFLTVATIGGFLALADLVQRFVIAPLAWVAPARKDRVLAGWQRWLAGTLIGLIRILGGGQIRAVTDDPFRSGRPRVDESPVAPGHPYRRPML